MIKIKYNIRNIKQKGEEYTPANERLKAIRASAIYDTKILSHELISVPTEYKEKKEEKGWLIKVKIKMSFITEIGIKENEVHEALMFAPIDGTDFGTPSSSLATAQTLAISKALAYAGIGIDNHVASKEEINGLSLPTEKVINILDNKINEIKETRKIEKEKEVVINYTEPIIPENLPHSAKDMSAKEVWLILEENISELFRDDEHFDLSRKTFSSGEKIYNSWRKDGIKGIIKTCKTLNYHIKFNNSKIAKLCLGLKDNQTIDNKEIERQGEMLGKAITKEDIEEINNREQDNKITLVKESFFILEMLPKINSSIKCFLFITGINSFIESLKEGFIIDVEGYQAEIVRTEERDGFMRIIAKPSDNKDISNMIFRKGASFSVKEPEKDIFIDENKSEMEIAYERLSIFRDTGLSDDELIKIISELYPQYNNLSEFVRNCNNNEFKNACSLI